MRLHVQFKLVYVNRSYIYMYVKVILNVISNVNLPGNVVYSTIFICIEPTHSSPHSIG